MTDIHRHKLSFRNTDIGVGVFCPCGYSLSGVNLIEFLETCTDASKPLRFESTSYLADTYQPAPAAAETVGRVISGEPFRTGALACGLCRGDAHTVYINPVCEEHAQREG